MPDSKYLSKESLVNILDSLEVGVVFVDKENRFAFVNKAGEEIRHIRSTDRLGTSILNCHSPKTRNKVLEDLKAFHNGDYASRHKMIKSKNQFFDNIYSVVKDENDEYEGVVLVSQNVTEKVRLENELKKANQELENKVKQRTEEIENAYEKLKIAQEQLMQSEKMAAIGQFVSGVAHEINNPLDGIQNCIRAVLGDLENKKQAEEYLPMAMESLFKIEILVKRLLDYARPHSSEKVNIDINDLVNEALELTSFKLIKKNITIETDLSEKPVNIYGEPHYLGQVLVNLIINAHDALDKNGKLSIITKQFNDHQIKMIIRDNGSGISEENLKKIFNPFFTTKQKNNGTGLGLYLSYNVIKEHSGQIEVNSRLGEGTEMIITFPRIDEDSINEPQELETVDCENE